MTDFFDRFKKIFGKEKEPEGETFWISDERTTTERVEEDERGEIGSKISPCNQDVPEDPKPREPEDHENQEKAADTALVGGEDLSYTGSPMAEADESPHDEGHAAEEPEMPCLTAPSTARRVLWDETTRAGRAAGPAALLDNDLSLWLPPPKLPDRQESTAPVEQGGGKDASAGAELDGAHLRSVYYEGFQRIALRHLEKIVLQLLQLEDLSDAANLHPIIIKLARAAAESIHLQEQVPDGETKPMDVRHYVKVKRVVHGKLDESRLVPGIVCRKNVVHRHMASSHEAPRIVLLLGALEYQRVENRLSSLDTLLEQEREHLRVAVARIAVHRPDVLLVEKTVSRYAQEIGKELGKEIGKETAKEIGKELGKELGSEVSPPPRCQLLAEETTGPAQGEPLGEAPEVAQADAEGDSADSCKSPEDNDGAVSTEKTDVVTRKRASTVTEEGALPLWPRNARGRPVSGDKSLDTFEVQQSKPPGTRLRRSSSESTFHRRSCSEPLLDVASLQPSKLKSGAPQSNSAKTPAELLLWENISVVLNVKTEVMLRVSRCTGAQMAASTEQLTEGSVGQCDSFYVKSFRNAQGGGSKTLMFFDGCPLQLGCTVLLHGDSKDTLTRMKRVLQFAVFAAYHQRLESALLADESVAVASAHFSGRTAAAAAAAAAQSELAWVEDKVMPAISMSPHVRLWSGDVRELCEMEKPQADEAVGSPRTMERQLNVSMATPLLLEQRLNVSVSSHCPVHGGGEMCEVPAIRCIANYRGNDVQLSEFLLAALPGPLKKCTDPHCAEGPAAHVRTYIHQRSKLTLLVHNLQGQWLHVEVAELHAIAGTASTQLSFALAAFQDFERHFQAGSPNLAADAEPQIRDVWSQLEAESKRLRAGLAAVVEGCNHDIGTWDVGSGPCRTVKDSGGVPMMDILGIHAVRRELHELIQSCSANIQEVAANMDRWQGRGGDLPAPIASERSMPPRLGRDIGKEMAKEIGKELGKEIGKETAKEIGK
eukprot:gene21668-26062_t